MVTPRHSACHQKRGVQIGALDRPLRPRLLGRRGLLDTGVPFLLAPSENAIGGVSEPSEPSVTSIPTASRASMPLTASVRNAPDLGAGVVRLRRAMARSPMLRAIAATVPAMPPPMTRVLPPRWVPV